MREEVIRRDVPDVHFTGFINQGAVSKAYVAADVFALLSREHETFGVVVAEAMNFGLPVVVSDKVGCGPDLVTAGTNGAICSPTDVESAVLALRQVAGDGESIRRMGAASRERIESWTQERTLAGILAAARGACANAATPSI